MKELLQQTKWQFVLLARNNIITISVIVTADLRGSVLGAEGPAEYGQSVLTLDDLQ